LVGEHRQSAGCIVDSHLADSHNDGKQIVDNRPAVWPIDSDLGLRFQVQAPASHRGWEAGDWLLAGYVLRRIVQAAVVTLGVLIITFLLVHLLPGGPARAILGARATAVTINEFNRSHGLDQSLTTQLWIYVKEAAQGNLGFSYKQNESVAALIAQRLPKDLLLVGLAYLIAVGVAIPLGIVQALRRNGSMDNVVTVVALTFYSIPSFLLALILIDVFSLRLNIFPPEAPQGDTLGSILSDPAGLVLPVMTLALITIAQFSRYMRSSAIETLALDYIRTARSKGLRERVVLTRHVMRNSLIPVITLIGLSIPFAVTGAIVVESVFNYPGMGLLLFNAATNQDYPVLLGITLFIGVATTIGNLGADLAVAVADPRIRVTT
jgi:peptide/nickel transport system permease protein